MDHLSNKTYSIGYKYQITIVNILQNNRYSSHYMIIKYIGFEPIIYAITRILSFSTVFSEFDLIFLSNVLLV